MAVSILNEGTNFPAPRVSLGRGPVQGAGEHAIHEVPMPRGRPGSEATTASVPILPRTYVPRLRLWERLDEASDGAVTLLVGPVGSGKTLGIAGWLRDRGRAHPEDVTWLHADPGWTPQLLARVLDDAAPAEPDGGPRLVVIDDAQALPPATMRLVDERLRDAPRSIRLLLASRWDLPLTRLMPELLGDLNVIRGDILRMDDEEAAAVVAPHLGTPDPTVISALIERGRGWCAVLVLTARSVAGAPDPLHAAQRLPRGAAAVADQVASEVFAALSARQRHLLLCVAGEGVVSASTAARLSNDRNAAQVLAELEITGLLVGRVPAAAIDLSTEPPFDDDVDRPSEDDPCYLIHPLLTEVVRRLLSVDGVDVARARAAVVRAVRLDVARGRASRSLSRLLRVNALGAAADVLARGGVYMVLSHGSGAEVADFSRQHPEMIQAHPATWFPVALERWLADDVEAARHWADRIVHESTHHADSASHGRGFPPRVLIGDDPTTSGGPQTLTWDAQVACVRMWRARLGLEPLQAAVGHAKLVALELREHQALSDVDAVVLPVLLEELGIAQNWLGELSEAEAHLTEALALARSEGLHALAASCMSHLALTQFMAGREHTAVEVATEALGLLGAEDVWRMEFAPSRAAVSLFLGGVVDVPRSLTEIAKTRIETGSRAHTADLCTRFWLRLRDARLAAFCGSVAGSERILTSPPDDPQLYETAAMPEHLRVVMLIAHGLLAAMSADDETLRTVEQDLLLLGAQGESRFVAGMRADCKGDRRSALAEFSAASTQTVYPQPATRAWALVCEAQLLDTLGEPELAMERLAHAAALTEVRRNADPFLGWVRQGTPIAVLLERLDARTSSAWVHAVAEASSDGPDIISRFESSTPLRHEPKEAMGALVGPALSPREREVLGELARGSTYADIGAALYVSENTVKTHVSSLYGKLGVSRRSEALAVARAHHLL